MDRGNGREEGKEVKIKLYMFFLLFINVGIFKY